MNKNYLLIITAVVMLSCNNNNSPATSTVTKPVEKITATKDQQDRRNQSEEYCKAHHVPTYNNPTALFVDAEEKVTLRTKDEIADRALALCYIGLKSEGLEQKYLDKMDKKYNVVSRMSPDEKIIAAASQLTEQQKADANWRYESFHVMLWALGFVDSLNYPGQLCDVASDSKIIFDLTEQQFRQKAKLRTKKEILDQADLILRLDWACVNARIKKAEAPGKLDKDVVFERHHSLNWLINYMNQEWDKVTTDT